MDSNTCSNILLTDDDDDDCLLFEDLITTIFPTVMVTRATNGKHLLELLSTKNVRVPDLIFLDINMPIKNGFEALAELKSSNELRQIPVIIYSTSAHTWALDKAFALGADYFVQKPSSASELVDILNKVLNIDWSLKSKVTRAQFLLK